jgi:hypothetical protein
MVKMLVGLAVVVAGVVGMVAFREPVTTYEVSIAGTGDQVGERVTVECEDGRALGDLADDERADAKCELEEGSAGTLQKVKFAVSAVIALVGLGVVYRAYKVWWRDLRSGMAYRRMAKDHDLAGGRRRPRKEGGAG